MFSKTNLISTLVTTIWGFMGGYLLWGILADSFLNNHLSTATGVGKEVPDWGFLALGCLIQAFTFSSVFKQWGAKHFNTICGLKYGILIGIFVGYGNELINYATTNVLDITGALVNGAIYIVFYAMMGFLTGYIYNKVK